MFFYFRNYNPEKIKANIECEIFQINLEEAQSSYDIDIVHEIRGDNESDFENNVKNISSWIENWREDNK